ncbi:MAG: hypothetical protein IPP97_04000 [Candidatus Obscuribacter sp.]|nr:hypothetical protein [Candidatus Obscuribacter sp.]
MPTRRSFLLSSIKWTTGSFLLQSLSLDLACQAKKTPRATTNFAGPHSLFKEEWPPAILPAHVGIADKGYLCFTDDFGRLAIVDMARKPQPGKPPFKVLASMSGLGKVVDFAVTNFAAYGLVYRENDNQEPVVTLISISLVPPTTPTIMHEMAIPSLSEASSIVAANDLVVISGTATSGETLVSVYSAPTRRGANHEPTCLASMTIKMPVRQLELSDKQLLVLSSDPTAGSSQLDSITLTNPSSPEIQSSCMIKGDYRVLAKFKDLAVVAGYQAGSRPGKGGCFARTISCGNNSREVSSITLDPMLTVESASAQKDRFVVVGRSQGKRTLITLVHDNSHSLLREQVLDLKTSKTENGLPAQGTAAVIYREPVIYVASGWSGVQMLSRTKEGFELTTSYSIPRLAASGLALWGSNVVLSGSELQLYNITKPEKPTLVSSSEPPSAIKSLVGAGSFVLCLAKEDLSLRKMDKLGTVLATTKLNANQICFDKSKQICYAIKSGDKSTRVQKIKVYPDSMEKDVAFDVPGVFNHCQVANGQLVLTGLMDLAYLTSDEGASTMTVKSTRHFDNFALRDVAITDDAILVTAIDKNLKGFFLVLAKNEGETRTQGSIDLPHDGVALAAQDTRAIAVGRSADGKDIATVINFAQPSAPQVATTMQVLEGVSSVSIRDKLAVLAGRGLEIVSL